MSGCHNAYATCKSVQRYVSCAANFSNRDTRICFVQKVQNLDVGVLRVSHRPYLALPHDLLRDEIIQSCFARKGWIMSTFSWRSFLQATGVAAARLASPIGMPAIIRSAHVASGTVKLGLFSSSGTTAN